MQWYTSLYSTVGKQTSKSLIQLIWASNSLNEWQDKSAQWIYSWSSTWRLQPAETTCWSDNLSTIPISITADFLSLSCLLANIIQGHMTVAGWTLSQSVPSLLYMIGNGNGFYSADGKNASSHNSWQLLNGEGKLLIFLSSHMSIFTIPSTNEVVQSMPWPKHKLLHECLHHIHWRLITEHLNDLIIKWQQFAVLSSMATSL